MKTALKSITRDTEDSSVVMCYETSEQELLLCVESSNFVDGKLKVNNGNFAFWATVTDKAFKSKVKNREFALGKGDMLKARFRMRQTIKNADFTSEYFITKVLEHRIKPVQVKINFED